MKLAIDAMSGDLGSEIVVEACLAFLDNNKEVELQVVGKIDELSRLNGLSRVELVEANEILDMTEDILAIRKKKDSSMVKCMMLAREGIVDGVVSCGNTGAYYASAMLFVKRIKGIEKSCLMATVPTLQGGVLMLDVGANVNSTSDQLCSFALMADVYAKNVLNIKSPRVGLLNIGSEEHKGDDLHKDTHHKLKDMNNLNFIGNIEGRDVFEDCVDIIVTDGFSGNICMKTMEGAAITMMDGLKMELSKNVRGVLGAIFSKPSLRRLKRTFSSDTAGGALLIGFEKPIVKAHGSSNAIAFENAIHLTSRMVEQDVCNKIKDGLE